MCNIVHQRQYNILYRIDQLFQFSKYATKQEELLNVIHKLTGGVIKTKKSEFAEKGAVAYAEEYQIKNNTKINTAESDKINQSNMRYARDDLDDIDENDVGE